MEEIFRKLNVEVGNLGTIKKDGVVLPQISGDTYNFVIIDGANIRVHVLVADAFPEICGKLEKWGHVHHINRDQRDNRADNLITLSRGEHRRLHALEDGVTKPVVAYDKDGMIFGEWESLKDAERATGAKQTHIGRCCRGERNTAGGLYWSYTEDQEEMESRFKEAREAKEKKRQAEEAVREAKRIERERKRRERDSVLVKKKRFLEYDENGTFIKEWNSIKDIAEYYDVSYTCIRQNVVGVVKYLKHNGIKRQFKKETYLAPKK